jgi:hypothetical protein
MERDLFGDIMVDKIKNSQETKLASIRSDSQTQRKSLVEIKVMTDTLNQLTKMVYGTGAAKVVDKINLGKLWEIKNADK